MGKNDFDIDFDFDEEYNFDPKAFLGTDEYDNNIDLNAFSDEELGLTYQKKADKAAKEEDFDLDDDLDMVVTGPEIREGLRVIHDPDRYLDLLGQTVLAGTGLHSDLISAMMGG